MKRSAFLVVGIMALTLAVAAFPVGPQAGGADETLAKRYAGLLGRYELDMTALGEGMHPVSVIVREGGLWLDDGDGRPAGIKPIGESGLEFEGRDANNGLISVIFSRDGSGAVVSLRLVMSAIGLDVSGKKIKSPGSAQ